MKSLLSLFIAATLLAPSLHAAKPANLPTPPSQANAGGLPAAGNASLEFAVAETIAGVGSLAGTLRIDGFVVDGGVIKADGSLDAVITDDAGTEVGSVAELDVLVPLTSTQGTSADLLHLEIGPVNVDVDGTVVTLSAEMVNLDVSSSSNKAFKRLLALAHRTLERETANLRQISNLLNLLLRLSAAE